MAYQTPITIKTAIEHIRQGVYVLPSIQREFVWNTEQIETLFDSIMRDYPIGTFLYWTISEGNVTKYQFYKFLQHYHEKDSRHNEKLDVFYKKGVTAILDGQQRLTSLFIGLCGSYAEKLTYSRWDSKHAFPRKRLYLNLLERCPYEEWEYLFVFLTDEEAAVKEDQYLLEDGERKVFASWYFQVSKILEFQSLEDVLNYLMSNSLTDSSKYTASQTQFALKCLSTLFNLIHQKPLISYYLEATDQLDKVLQIFIRTNAGGTKLSYSDLLLSVASAQWVKLDAREEIHSFVDEINSIGSGFNFTKDFVMKSFLVLGDFPDVVFKVDNFTRENMLMIESKWPDISSALNISVQLVSRFGFSRDNLTSVNALIPIAYYVLKRRHEESFINSPKYADDRAIIKEWLIRSLCKRVFGSASDSIYPPIRKIISEDSAGFPLPKIIDQFKGTAKSITFSDEDIDSILDLEYNDKLTFSVLSLLYDGINMNYHYHVDHIHPRTMFSDANLKKLEITNEEYSQFKNNYNCIPNLMLLEDRDNVSKSKTPFKQWIENKFNNARERNAYLQSQFIIVDTSIEFKDFLDFFAARKSVIKRNLSKILGVH